MHPVHPADPVDPLDPWPAWAAEQRAFRDALRADPRLRQAYADLKRGLAGLHAGDREAYTAGKTAFVHAALERSRRD